MIDNSPDTKTIQFKFPLSIFLQLDQRLQKHPLYQYAIDLLSKNKIHEEFLLFNSTEKVENRKSIEKLISNLIDYRFLIHFVQQQRFVYYQIQLNLFEN